jgi:methanogenic corrinoid protein MtbC1
LRAWERRYGAVIPDRDEKGRRQYAPADITRLRLLREVVELGHPIRRVAGLDTADLQSLLADADNKEDLSTDRLVNGLLDAATNYEPEICSENLGLAIATLPPLDAVRRVIAPALKEAGERWHRGEMGVSQEHLLTACVERLVFATMHTFNRPMPGPTILFGTLTGENHGLGSLLATFIAASYGARAIYLGTNLPPSELAKAASRSNAVAIGVGVTSSGQDAAVQLAELCNLLDPGTMVWLGGTAIGMLDPMPPACIVLADFEALAQQVDMICTAASV